MALITGNTGNEPTLFDLNGQRKYLYGTEGRRFLEAAAKADVPTRALCRLLNYTGCRISEALEVTPRRLDAESGCVVFRTLKRRRRTFRAVPIPAEVMRELKRLADSLSADTPLWPWCRQTAWRHIKRVMVDARIAGPQAMPRGLRHQFGVLALQSNLPLALTQRLLGHASPRTTAIYQNVGGAETRRLVSRMWQDRV